MIKINHQERNLSEAFTAVGLRSIAKLVYLSVLAKSTSLKLTREFTSTILMN